jgi:EAL domain-containing protein (putative c-di-GMP-specific phosphodiesterase class I)/FixJ family two-component response regulator
VESGHADQRAVRGLPSGGVDSGLGSAGVLIIDDQPANVALLERLLRRMGVDRTIGITDPRQALQHYRAMDPDLVLLDLHMPHIGGLDLMEALDREIPSDSFVPILVLTADATDRAKQDALGAGATDFLTKPFDHTEVVLRVRNLLRTRFLHVALQSRNANLQLELQRRKQFEVRLAEERAKRLRRVQGILESGSFTMLFQPVIRLSDGVQVGAEALARFSASPQRPPDEWFAEAASVGLGPELEIAAVKAALAQMSLIPPDTYMAVNVSPSTVGDARLKAAILPHAERVVLELTEHEAVEGYDALLIALNELREGGVRLAVDDAGAGYAGLRHILRVNPDIIKLDIALVHDIDTDPARRALAASLVAFGKETGASIVAEGIERRAEAETVRSLQVGFGQGFHFGRPSQMGGSCGLTSGVA